MPKHREEIKNKILYCSSSFLNLYKTCQQLINTTTKHSYIKIKVYLHTCLSYKFLCFELLSL